MSLEAELSALHKLLLRSEPLQLRGRSLRRVDDEPWPLTAAACGVMLSMREVKPDEPPEP